MKKTNIMQEHFPNLVLPKPHLSWTQLSCWISNKERYKKEYFQDGDKLDTKFLRFGKNIAEIIEKGQHKELLPDLETYDSPEFEIKTKIKDLVPCLSFIDTYDSKTNVFREFKTGKLPWTKAKVQKHDQLVFYATMLKAHTGSMPQYCDLDWIETKEIVEPVTDFWREGGKMITVTGRIVSFHREFDEREILRMEDLIERVAYEIRDSSQSYIKEF